MDKPFKYLVISERWDDVGYLYQAEPMFKLDFEGYRINSRTLVFTPKSIEQNRKEYEELDQTLSSYAFDVLTSTKSILVFPNDVELETVKILYGSKSGS
jgi:hypothetical protein